MSRVHAALRRAAQSGSAAVPIPADGHTPLLREDAFQTEFAAGEEPPDQRSRREEPGQRAFNVPPPSGNGANGRAVPEPVVSEPEERVPAYQASPPRANRDDVSIGQVLGLAASRWKLIGAVVAASLAAAVGYNAKATPVYEAHSRVLVEPETAQVAPFQQSGQDTGRVDYFVTQMDVLRSRDLARKTLESLHVLNSDPARQVGQINQLIGALAVTPTKSDLGESRVINLVYRSNDPALAARVVNSLAETYVAQNLEDRRQGARDASEWLNERLGELRKEVNVRQGDLQKYRESRDVSLDQGQNIVVQKLAQLNATLTAARTERLDREGLYNQLQAIRSSGAPLDTFPPILASTFIQGLKAEVANLSREREQLAERLGDLHPDMIKATTTLQAAQRRLDAEMAKVAEGVLNDYKAAKAKEQALSAALEAQKREVLNLDQKSIAYSALQRDAASTQQIFESVLQRLKETELSGQLQANNARVLDMAEVPRTPIWPRKQLNLFVALFGGAFLGIGFAAGLVYLNPQIVRPGDVEESLGLHLLGVAPYSPVLKNGVLRVESLPPVFLEAIRSLRTRVLLTLPSQGARTLAVTSTTSGEGKTLMASSLAVSMSMAGRQVLLIDADMRRPRVHGVFDMPNSPGLSDVLRGKIDPLDAVRESNGFFVLPAGSAVDNPSELLESETLANVVRVFSQAFDVVLFDCPPVMPVTDATILANAASAVLFVIGSGTNREAASVAVNRLASVGAHLVGAVLNSAKLHRSSAYQYEYYAPRTSRRGETSVLARQDI